ncbi:conserved Plasmodium protein, unknown function [Plasmodium knowlesi strain H]|uniref:RNA-binding protein, putative n=3 Tax=Plasmodium knowlesi TaxID=5850 RepID=A0A679L8C1_PLAKH|nr:RNA-binding protein, putative [Plasmodium knowlesi strain H]OTN63732.1 Uncharacterized protein PKNOH_S140282300 [Plasmodium knowlesi]CAA9991233.1 RNA-binding protein, putative [Plasmodium knowlesi strain H]SBO26307.1 conserved Plasmodium protein, unknown function [Plasmodium knowlesi strain H]VVS80707.1 RNA-binding protein, putative [Plasmodium knowlesi strain H]
MRALFSAVILSVLFSLRNQNKVKCYRIQGRLGSCKRSAAVTISKNTDESNSENAQNNSLVKRKKRYSFTPLKRNTIKDIKRRIKFNEKNVRPQNGSFYKKKDIHKSLIDDINKEMLKESIKSVGINYEREEIAKHNILPLPVEDKTSECYNCLVLCKGMPFHVDTARIREFFNPYKLVEKYTIFIKDKKGNFFGDVMVRFTNKKEKLLALKNKNFKFLMHRYIQLYNINEEHYEEYFNVGYKNPPSYKNYVPIKNVVVSSALEDLDPLAEERSTDGDGTLSSVHPTSDDKYQYHSFFCDPLDNDVETKELRDKVNKKGILLKSIYTGKKLRGRITSVHPYGVFVDCDVYVKDKNGRFIKILALLHKNKLTINIGLPTDPLPEQEEKELILQKNMNIIVYVDKIIKRDIDPSGSNSKDGKNNLIFFNLTFDSSITEEKIQWLQSLKLKRKSIEEKMKACNDRFLSMSSEGGVTGGLGGGAPEVREKESPWEGNNPSKVVGTDITEETNKSEGITVLKGEKMSSSQKLCNVQSCKTEEFFSSEEKDESKLNSSSKNKRNHNSRSSKIYLMRDTHCDFKFFGRKWNKRGNVRGMLSLNSNGEAEQSEGIQNNEKRNPKGRNKIKKKKKKKNLDDSDVYDEDDNFDEIFKLEVGDAEGQEEVYSGNENVDRVADSENAAIEQDSLSDDKNKRSEKKVTNHYNDEMKGILDDIFRKEEDGGSPSKKASMKVRTDKCNQGTTVEQTLGQCFENVSDRSKWKNDIRKEESIFYSKMFGLKTDINDFYSDGSRGKDTDGVGSNSDNMEEFMKLSEGAGEGGDSSNDIHSETIKFEGLESWMEQGKKDEMIEEEELEGEEEPIKEQAGEELEQGGLNMEQANGDPMNSIITGKDGEALDFSHFAEMTTEELKSEIYKKKFLLPIDVSRESLKNRLVQIYICEKNKIKFDNYPFIRYYLFDFNVPVEDIKLFVLANKKFLNKKNINLNLLNSLNLNELKYLLHKSMENIRLWEPEDKIKRKILNLNNDLLQKQNMNNVDDVDANNLLILWNDFKDFLLNCVYGNDTTSDSWGADFRNLSTTNCEPTTSYSTNNANTQKYLNRMKNMEKENFFIGKKIPVDDELEKQINKKKMKHMDPFENALSTLNKELDENEAELPDKISLKEAMKILNNRSYMKKIKRALNNDSDERTNEEYIDKIISLILKHKNYFKENLSEAILRKKPHEELIILLDQLPADLIEDLL